MERIKGKSSRGWQENIPPKPRYLPGDFVCCNNEVAMVEEVKNSGFGWNMYCITVVDSGEKDDCELPQTVTL